MVGKSRLNAMHGQKLSYYGKGFLHLESGAAVDLLERLRQTAGCQVALCVTDNRRNMVSWKRRNNGALEIRVHHMFLAAPPAVQKALVEAFPSAIEARKEIQLFIEQNRHLVRANPKCRPRSVGRYYDLHIIHQGLNLRHFKGASSAAVTWGGPIKCSLAKRIRFGSYDAKSNVITMSRRLDDGNVPVYMVEFVMYHEMLHEILTRHHQEPSPRQRIHSRQFRDFEQKFPQYEKALEFQKQYWGVI